MTTFTLASKDQLTFARTMSELPWQGIRLP